MWMSMPFPGVDLVPVGAALALALLITPAVGALARRWGVVARPQSDRWHKQPTALLGGVAIFAPVVIVLFGWEPANAPLFAILGAASVLFAVGLVDDLRHIKPYQKLVGQMVGAGVFLTAASRLELTEWPWLNVAVALFWLVGICNALNLLDNMDGLAAGTAALAAFFLAWHFHAVGRTVEARWLAVFAAVLLGFLVYNFNPATIFMGDCGSLFIGFFLASTALEGVAGGSQENLATMVAIPILVLIVPIFDTTLVTIVRPLNGRAISQGGRDHASHRLVALGLSERGAVAVLCGLSVLGGLLAVGLDTMGLALAFSLSAAFLSGLLVLGVCLARIKIYDNPVSHSQR
jgi:UDP-GlcNAc:undecaprenyl-phosphate GlcNAc-1-phosphate transferase